MGEPIKYYVIVHRVKGLDLPAFITQDYEKALEVFIEWRSYGYNPLWCYASEEKE